MDRAPLLIAGTVVALCALTTTAVSAHGGDVDEGHAYFTRYCASCHGPNADGRGPVAPVLRTAPTDLRHLAQRYGTPLPFDRVARFVDGRESVSAHGDRDMPVWGERFHEIEAEGAVREAEIRTRIRKIIAYLDSIQVKN